ncbi:hypothetical protein CONCODRAFT_13244 [Conidiobolus coronatus NRRL 28638]|uniref:G-protein coupled receptors family 1 profile domain-containing protein n=1 Tax=Conidiobolus coronatus (strain ATCC 28846 / CBS 209.66 / NRRL 28638) TaxID=796925 RepID=A0A137NR45_CONC2|nr:hypothetical protein CONCODRAFT_13244 [Conidiobolus coronatus NRRL 28638]|eukprot:KXN65243.1 hypothetical protein CONCODRAFT_13244 [Conidiobolus coronatus NRRL 28638]
MQEVAAGSELLGFAIGKLRYGSHYLDADTKACKAAGFIVQWIARVEITTVSILSTLRYLIVCHKKEKSLRFWLIILALSLVPCTFIYIYGAAKKDSTPTVSYLHCQPYSLPSKLSSVMTIVIPFLYLIPCWVVTYCYFAIGVTANKHLNTLKREAHTNGDEHLLKIITQQKFKMVIQLLLVFVIYNVNFMLSYITFILKYAIGYKRPPIIDALVFVMVHGTVAINPIITITFQPDVNNEFVMILVRFQARFKKRIRNLFYNR